MHEKYIKAKDFEKLSFRVSTLSKHRKNKTWYYDLPVAFDIETSSFTEIDLCGDEVERACMYVWQMCLGDPDGQHDVIVGRTWDEFEEFINKLVKIFRLKHNRILVCYCHNLAYEFQWIAHRFEWKKVFAIKERVPLYALTTNNIEFRCSYRLSGYKLELVAKNLINHRMRKLVGNLDYSLIRHSKSYISPDEMDYNILDVKIVCAYIAECLERENGNICKIPLTKTGYVRRECKNACYGLDHNARKYKRYRKVMQALTLEMEEYNMLKDAFAGGFTHANAYAVGKTISKVTSMDFTSSYPYCAFAYPMPWSKGEIMENPDWRQIVKDIRTFFWILEVEYTKIESTFFEEDFIQKYKCKMLHGASINNGRVYSADFLSITLTSYDFRLIEKLYRYKSMKIKRAIKYKTAYLPTDFVKCMLSFYEGKTTLKNVEGMAAEYLSKKENLNSFYGMCVTDPLRDIIDFDEEWSTKKLKGEEAVKALEKYNNSANRFMFYPVGVAITSIARFNLWNGIYNLGSDYIYSDTDSVKFKNAENHADYFKKYNQNVERRLKMACEHHGISFDMVNPITQDGKHKMLGVWDPDGFYLHFKTLGAKRYLGEYPDGHYNLTVAGLNKEKALPYMLEKYGKEKIFEEFKTDNEFVGECLEVPAGFSGRSISTYIDYPTKGHIVDYRGCRGRYEELSSVNLKETTYKMNIDSDYIEFLFGRLRDYE